MYWSSLLEKHQVQIKFTIINNFPQFISGFAAQKLNHAKLTEGVGVLRGYIKSARQQTVR